MSPAYLPCPCVAAIRAHSRLCPAAQWACWLCRTWQGRGRVRWSAAKGACRASTPGLLKQSQPLRPACVQPYSTTHQHVQLHPPFQGAVDGRLAARAALDIARAPPAAAAPAAGQEGASASGLRHHAANGGLRTQHSGSAQRAQQGCDLPALRHSRTGVGSLILDGCPHVSGAPALVQERAGQEKGNNLNLRVAAYHAGRVEQSPTVQHAHVKTTSRDARHHAARITACPAAP